ncbi:hypothetical protein IC229_14325 [Spirosoma sp. BT702]|uniref:DoxX family protein n=1 Tax=Spirosoma profusum TaxID=2771354 RepID=A0A926XW41_9BACT|nr:hypothetical protein [Spirosoma profusum]MBD2701824.1 hypothetical protein [Spirosoma profusum]
MQNTLVESPIWSVGHKIAFRFFCAYFVLYTFPFPISIVPGLGLEFYTNLWHLIVPWVGKTILHLPYEITVFPNGSGDTTYNYVYVLCLAVLALITTIILTILDRRRPNYNVALYWLFVLLRYYLAFTMFSYGFAKVFKTQFPFPNLSRLMEPYGESSPMGLAWAFMGYSTGYNIFTGMGEVVGGALLLFRRTIMLGCLMLIGVIGNIVAMNFFYDIPVKLFSSHLLAITLFLLAPDAGRLVDLFILNRPVPNRKLTPFFPERQQRIGRLIVKTLVILYSLWGTVQISYYTKKNYGDTASEPPLNGLYRIDRFAVNGDSLVADSTRWRQVIISGYKGAPTLSIRFANDTLRRYQFEPDSATSKAVLYVRFDTAHKHHLTYLRPDTNSIILRGRINQDSIYARLQKQQIGNFLLVNRGFHWINEYPFNR